MAELLNILPLWNQYTFVVILGLIIGSFLDVVITRFHTGKSINGRSRCLSCGHTLSWYELFPLLSYIVLLGRCKECHAHIAFRLLVMEVVTAVLFLTAFTQVSFGLPFIFALVLISILLIITVYDIDHMVIPDQLVVGSSVLAVVYFVIEYGFTWNTQAVFSHAGAALGAFLFYGGLWFVSKGRWIGFGDAKLAIPLGFILGTPAVFSFIVLSFWIGAGISICLLLTPWIIGLIKSCCTKSSVANSSKSLTMKSEVPFAPFMIAAFLLVFLYHFDVLSLTALLI